MPSPPRENTRSALSASGSAMTYVRAGRPLTVKAVTKPIPVAATRPRSSSCKGTVVCGACDLLGGSKRKETRCDEKWGRDAYGVASSSYALSARNDLLVKDDVQK